MLGLLLILLVFVILTLQVDSVQTFLARRVAAYLSSELKTTIQIKGLSFRLVKSVVLKGVLIEDLKHDTLLYAEELNVGITSLSTKNRILKINTLKLVNATFNLNRYSGEQHDNLFFLTEYFSSSDTTSPTSPWKVSLKNISLSNLHFTRWIEEDTAKVRGVNFSDLDVNSIFGSINNFQVVNESTYADFDRLRFNEKSGFSVNEFSGKSKLTSQQIKIDHFILNTPNTKLSTDISFYFNSFNSFNEFTKQVQWKSDFKNSTISFKDIAYFTDDLWGMKDSIQVDGYFKGSVNRFKGKNITFKWGEKSLLTGNISMSGLPVIEDTYIELSADEIRINKKDIESIPLPPFDENKHLEIPENLKPLGTVIFKGKFNGFYNDFVAYGTVKTDLGLITSDLNLKYNKKTNESSFSGHIASSQFNAGVIAKLPDLGKVTMSLDVKGAGLHFEDLNATINGNIEALSYKNYIYRKIDVDGKFAKKLFKGSISVNEPNVDFDFNGIIDYSQKLPVFDFVANVRRAQLDTLNLFKIEGGNVLQTNITTHFVGNRPDNIVGEIQITNTNFQAGKKLYHINNISLNSQTENSIRTVDILSDNLDMHCKGIFEFATLTDAFKEIIPLYLPSVILPKKSFFSNQNFTFDIRLKNLNVITENFLPSWDFAPNTNITGHFNSRQYDFHLNLLTPYVRYKGLNFQELSMSINTDRNKMILISKSKKIAGNDSISIIEEPQINAIASNNKISYTLHLADSEIYANRGRLIGNVDFESASKFKLTVDSSLLVIEKQNWFLENKNQIVFDSSQIDVTKLSFRKGIEAIEIGGRISKNSTDKFNISLSNFGMDHFNTLAKANQNFLGGSMNGQIHISDVYHKLQLESNLLISNFTINKDTIGNMSINSVYNSEKEMISSAIVATKGSAKIIDIKGDYLLSKDEDNIDYTIYLDNMYLHPLERYVSNIFTNMYGKVSSDLRLTGSFKKPLLNGTISLNKVSFLINYLQTHYSFTSDIKVKNNEIQLKDLIINDDNNNQASLNGKVTHQFFRNFRFDVVMDANRFQILNTKERDNSLYYGIANGTGYAHFYGPLENMNMDISMSPSRGTVVNIPLNTSSDLSQSGYITFIDKSADSTLKISRGSNVDLSGVKLNMNLDMNQNALINIIFDEKIGDVISGTGTGSLRLDINTAGNFNMYGTYTIENGDYLFTLQNLINKKFTIDNGSRITWAGEPYDANVDISATYILYTSSLYNLLADSSYKRRIPVECKLFLTNKLLNPTINYEINVRGLDPTAEGLVKSLLNSEQEINKQMFGLLVLNQFVPQSGAGQVGRLDAGAGAGASASELLSNQVSNWLGQFNKVVNIGVNFKPKDTYSSEEYQLLLSKSVLNDRLTFEGNVGYLNNTTQSYATSSVVGDFNAEFKVSEDGRFRIKGFNRSNADNIINYSQSPYTQGLGIFYRKDFNEFSDLFKRYRAKENEKPKK